PTGQVVRYDIEVWPTFALLPAGHRIRVTINSSDAPYATPVGSQYANLAGGLYDVQRNAGAASYVVLPLLAPPAVTTAPGPRPPGACTGGVGAGRVGFSTGVRTTGVFTV